VQEKRKSSSQRQRFGIALLLLTAVCLYGNFDLLYSRILDYPGRNWEDPVTIHEKRMESLKASLPSISSVGYVTTVENEKLFSLEKSFRDVEFLAQFIVTQYALTPVFVYNSPDHPVVVGVFLSGPPDPAFLRRYRLVPKKDMGDGVILFERRGES